MLKIEIYTKEHCPYCERAKALFRQKDLPFKEIRVDLDPKMREHMEKLSGRRTVPQIFMDEKHIGGCDDLMAFHQSGALDQLIARSKEA